MQAECSFIIYAASRLEIETKYHNTSEILLVEETIDILKEQKIDFKI